MTRKISLALVALLLSVTAALTAQGTARHIVPQQPGFKFLAPWRPAYAKSGGTKIVGTVIDIRQVPVGNARVRLRDLDKGVILGESETNDYGEYSFETLEPGTYIVEVILMDGKVIALSNAGAVARYETLNTVVQLPGRWDVASHSVAMSNNLSGFVGVSAETTMTSLTVAIAGTTNISPADAGEPVSP
jgi:hypothetical protein